MTFIPPLSELSLRAQVAQMVVVRASGYLYDSQIQYPAWEPPQNTLKHWIKDWGVGGVILLGGSAVEVAERCCQLQSWATIPLLLAADIEEGVGQRFSGATQFPPPAALGAIAQKNRERAVDLAKEMGAYTAAEALAIGLNWVLAPVVDVNNNPANPVINVRAFGEEPDIVSALATAFIQGARAYPVLTTAKHFPGHGDTATDSHLELPVIPHDRDRLQAIEWPPFIAAIAAGVDTVMSAHVHLPALDAERPATLSPPILTGILRQEMGFKGLIVTDALVMGAIANTYGTAEAAVKAVEAGADILLMPLDPPAAIEAVVAAVESGRIPPERIQAAVARIQAAKARLQPLALQLDYFQTTPAVEVATTIAQDSLERAGQALQPVPLGVNCLIVDDTLHASFLNRTCPALTLPPTWGFDQRVVIDQQTPLTMIEGFPKAPTLVQVFSRGNPFRGKAGLSAPAIATLERLQAQNQLAGLVVYGSPYAYREIAQHLHSDVPRVFSYGHYSIAQGLTLASLLKVS
ncbi:glycoside hydrolase family 3 N-terminal domain-containing protein [Thermosynechococcus sp. GLH187]|uniref:glycoside hydrolase family 3 N-terminal domain-containing protein n=1 Tax=unclassified Thermosynechococcus TaxID=2622553 RepID=UPI002877A8E2|nr:MULTISPECIES: glycoside hydrolase family 3 N-terminal domain-containing protein [unclassified Thermosynechococcus]WNC45497.1 glycoside hydrolase family 3 N-terminal domain-containing protein [Thermosynechococcus sp. GLH187]WNC48033.1 glycoside hydrolase family 3 N-terminal domain-containing protein [Thermosynechococcus sp. GLH333]WNC50569.1 glycoside hydrolase family 3 N-terminal domain-containing protein [Thermosynechococcus sp. GLH87]WNC53109.1 glycoside hydrolase family 3 N-terminal domai